MKGNYILTEYRITKTMITHAWCEVEADNDDEAEEIAINNDAWFEDDNDYDNEYEVEKV